MSTHTARRYSKQSLNMVLAVLWLLLSAWLVYRWSYPPRLPELPPLSEADSPLVGTDSLDGVALVPEVDALERYGELIARPLFYPNRRPQAASVAEIPQEVHRETIDDLTLVGVMHIADVARVLVKDERSGRVSRMMLGDRLGGWQLKSVGAEHITMVQQDNERVLHLVRNQRQPRAVPSMDDSAELEAPTPIEPDENHNEQGDVSEAG